MSLPLFLGLPSCARAFRLRTGRGEFAGLESLPPEGVARRGSALLVPGFTGSKEDFLALLEPLARRGFRVVAVDGRGQHESGGPREESAYAQDELAQDILAQAAAIAAQDGLAQTTARTGHGQATARTGLAQEAPHTGLTQKATTPAAAQKPPAAGGEPLHLLGHSLGGLITRAAVLKDPSPFASYTIMASGPAAICEAQQARTRILIDALGRFDMETVWRSMRTLDPPEAANAATPPAVAEFLYRRWLNTVPEQLVATGGQLLVEPDRVAELAAVPLPKHVLSGAVDYAWPIPLMDDMAVRLRAHRTVIEGAEHSPGVERPGPTAEAMADFWERHASA
ncbi:alpha/beta hydrolase [Streptomyces pathocidini]|uniref:alpha/beta fold hydrolase n=1 Tax=Streptomyces pathocidini TaxID=1650571 RepID=UPI0033D438FA